VPWLVVEGFLVVHSLVPYGNFGYTRFATDLPSTLSAFESILLSSDFDMRPALTA